MMLGSAESAALRVLFDHQVFSFQRYGGISRYVVELARRFAQSGEVQCDLPVRYSDNEYLRAWAQPKVRPSLALPGLGPRGRFLATYLANGICSRRALARAEFDVFHPTFYDDYFLRRLGGRPFVITVHDMIPERWPELFPRKTLYERKVTARWIDSKARLVRSAARVIAITQHTKSDLVELYGIEPDRVDVIWQAGTLSNLMPLPSKADNASQFVLFVGGRSGYKNFCRFANAMRGVLARDAELRVLCIGGGSLTVREQALLSELDVLHRFSQCDVDDTQLAASYARARAFVFPSLYEGFGIPIVEAMSCGCPCVLSDTGCFREVASDAAEYFDPMDADEMASSIQRVIESPDVREGLVRRGLSRSGVFSWDNTAARTVEVYKAAVRA